MHPQTIQFHIEQAVGFITLCRPDCFNALTQECWTQISDAIDTFEADTQVNIIVIRGANEDFGAGADINTFDTTQRSPEEIHAYFQAMNQSLNKIRACSKPTIAVIKGKCLGASVSLALATDIRFASENSRYAIPPAKLGLIYPIDDVKRLLELVNEDVALSLLYTAKVFTAREAKEYGLVTEVYDDASLDDTVSQTLKTMNDLSQWSIVNSKAMIKSLSPHSTKSFDYEPILTETITGPDLKARVLAFKNRKR